MRKKHCIGFVIMVVFFIIFVSFKVSADHPSRNKNNTETPNNDYVVENEYNEIIIKNNIHTHSFLQSEIYPPICTENGKVISVCECGEISEKILDAVGHTFEDEIEYATCIKDGYYNRICFICGYVENVEKSLATGHTYNEWVVEKDSTKFETGLKSRVCKNCGNKEEKMIEKKELYPIIEQGDGYTITITKEWYENAWVYAAHLQFDDYDMMKTGCANGKYNNGYETTSHFANRIGTILAINGCYSAPYLNYTVIRDGVICNGDDRASLCLPAVYSNTTGILESCWEGQAPKHIAGKSVQELVNNKIVTDTFCFGPPNLVNGVNVSGNNGSRAQRTFIGTNGDAGDIWVFVSDGRYIDGVSAGLTGYQTAEYMKNKGCTFGVNLDGGGSSTMVYRGYILNTIKEERAVVDFVYFK